MEDSLQTQLLSRVATFQKNFPGISKADIARHCQIDEANFSAALNGRRGLSVDGILRLHTLLNTPRNQVMAKFGKSCPTSRILHFQDRQSNMQLANDGWLPREGSTHDPDGTEDITQISDAASNNGYDEATTRLLKQVRSLHRQAIKTINAALNKARPNPTGVTDPNGQRFSTRNIVKKLYS
jgi:hypothetical protein